MNRWLLCYVFAGACTQVDLVATLPGTTDAGPVQETCDQTPVNVGDQPADCTGLIAERTFRYAICSCEDYAGSASLITDSFDSRVGVSVGRGGSVGVNGRFAAGASISVGGSLRVSGLVASASPVQIASELWVDGPAEADGPLTVGQDAFVAGNVRGRPLMIAGTLTSPGPVDLGGGQVGGQITASVSVPDPCRCDDLLDIPALVERHRMQNDNARIALSPNALSNYFGPQIFSLPCGRFFLERLSGQGGITIQITGRATLFVAGDLAVDGPFQLELAPEAQLDLFIAGGVVSNEPLILGSAARPASVRLYVGTRGTLQLSGGGLFAGNLYAPTAELVTSGPVELFGSLFVRRLAASAPIHVHYDSAVLRAGEDCQAPTCQGCDCGELACRDGVCQACLTNLDCCAPTVCVDGACRADPF